MTIKDPIVSDQLPGKVCVPCPWRLSSEYWD